ncbi:Heterogeneous nuclear ribonucleoprotein K homolog [Geodia barretti]|uniref:Heterogeneous nuclear ribonucleoprotein K homolog n=1 Tax=Geodia barretti TaxID=519541 RepID=A0AA35QUQ9_GEOBA|nr:Heterogeneous nuclear ribonucleoprotein K homolog [Geodia barretti]
MASGNQFSDDSPFADKYGPPPVGRKRPMDQQFGGDMGGEIDGDLGPDFQKRSRFDSPQVESELDRLDVPPATLRILVRQIDAGGIIGKGGENIKRLRKVHDCQVVLPDSPGAPERVMTVMGRIEGCIGVLRDCLPKLGDGPVQQHGDPNQLAFETQVLIPQPFMGTIIGTAGSKIKELRSKTKTSIKIFSDPMPNSNERVSSSLEQNSRSLSACSTSSTKSARRSLGSQFISTNRLPSFLLAPSQMISRPLGAGGTISGEAWMEEGEAEEVEDGGEGEEEEIEEEEVEGSRDRGGVVITGGQGEILISPPTNLLQIRLHRWGEGEVTVHLPTSLVEPLRTEGQGLRPVSATPQCHRPRLPPPCLHPPPVRLWCRKIIVN